MAAAGAFPGPAERGRDGLELAYARQRFLVECVAAGVVAIDAPYTWRDAEGVERDTRWARRLASAAAAPASGSARQPYSCQRAPSAA